MFNQDVFGTKPKDVIIPRECNVVFVSDAFAEDYPGGAELTTKALIDSKPDSIKIFKIHASKVTQATLESGYQKYWIFGNFTTLNPNLIPQFVQNCKYSIIEYDYKFCKYRSTEKHFENEQKKCDCHDSVQGKIISAFMYGSENLMWMSEGQRDFYFKIFPFLEEKNNYVVSSAFSEETIDRYSY